MKKVISFILALALCVSLCACSRNMAEKGPTSQNAAVSSDSPAVANEDRIEFKEPIVLVSNNNLKLEVTNIFQADTNFGTAIENDKYITLKCQSKTDRSYLVILNQLSIDNNAADVYRGTTSIEVAPKGEAVQDFRIRINNSTPLNDMMDLFQLRGTLSVYLVKQDGNRDRLEDIPFYVAEAFSGISNSTAAEAMPVELSLGETAVTDVAEFTLTGFETCDAVKIDKNSAWGKLGVTPPTPDRGMVYAAPIFTLRNTGKEIYNVSKVCNFVVDYNSGYRYAMDDYVCYINHEEGTWERRAVGTSSGQRPELSPLMSGTYQVFIPAVDLIETDQKSSLLLIVKLPTSNGSQEFVYRLR